MAKLDTRLAERPSSMTQQKLTPMMEQFYSIKERYSDCIIFFRLGDFYEMFDEDAVVASGILDITLTSRNKGADQLPMCGVPYHSAEGYIQKLIFHGKKVAICEQTSDPSLPGLVTRDVVRIVTPGTNIDNVNNDASVVTRVIALVVERGSLGFSFSDLSTGEWVLDQTKLSDLADVLSRVRASEVVLEKSLYELPEVYQILSQSKVLVTIKSNVKEYVQALTVQLQTSSLTAFELDEDHDKLSLQAAANLLAYLQETQKRNLPHMNRIKKLRQQDYLVLDSTTISNLELFVTQIDQQTIGSLFKAINFCRTNVGARMLASWITFPLKSIHEIQVRQKLVESFYQQFGQSVELQKLIKQTADLQRLAGRCSLNYGTPRDLAAIRDTLDLLPQIKNLLSGFKREELTAFADKLPELTGLKDLLKEALTENPPASSQDTGIVASGYDEVVDQYRSLHQDSKAVLDRFLEQEKATTGIANLKLGYNKVIGYFLEVSRGKLESVPANYIVKQTLTNAHRYVTPELKDYEVKLLEAGHELQRREFEIFQTLVASVVEQLEDLKTVGEMIAVLDCYLGLAELAIKHNYKKPELVDAKAGLEIVNGRHPVIEQLLIDQKFIANDAFLGGNNARVNVITGPNMGGKSTYLRQTALIVLLAHIGSFVPADAAKIPLTSRIFTRIGAGDNLSKGRSTFMVEMQELAVILRQSDANSLLIIDEIGRGTSTFDGISIAWSTLEWIHNKIGAKCLFSTHYHELINVAADLSAAANYSMAVHQENNQITFLHKVQQGGMNDSFGIHVADLAGIPAEVVESAKQKLEILEGGEVIRKIERSTLIRPKRKIDTNQQDLFSTQIYENPQVK